MQSADDMERGEADARLEGEWPRRPFKRGRKINIAGTIIMSVYVMALIFYLWVRISKTLQLGPKPYVMYVPPSHHHPVDDIRLCWAINCTAKVWSVWSCMKFALMCISHIGDLSSC